MKRRWLAIIILIGVTIAGLLHFSTQQGILGTPTLVPFRFVQVPHNTGHVEFASDGRELVLDDFWDSHSVTAFDFATGQQTRQQLHTPGETGINRDFKHTVEYTPQAQPGRMRITVRSSKNGRILRQWIGGKVLMGLSNDLSLALTNDGAGNATLQETATGRVRGNCSTKNAHWAEPIRFSDDGRYLVIVGYYVPSQILRTSDLHPVVTLPILSSATLSWDSKRLVGLTENGILHIWQLPSGAHTSVITGLTKCEWAAEIKNGSLLVVGHGTDKNGGELTELRTGNGLQELYRVHGFPCAYSWDGRFIGVRYQQYDATNPRYRQYGFNIYDTLQRKQVAYLDAAGDPYGNSTGDGFLFHGELAIAPDGHRFAYASYDGLIRYYDLAHPGSYRSAGKIKGRTIATAAHFSSSEITFDGIGKSLSSQGDEWLKFDAGTGQPVAVKVPASVRPNGRVLHVETAGEIRMLCQGEYGDGSITLQRWNLDGKFLGKQVIVPPQKIMDGWNWNLASAQPSPDNRSIALLWQSYSDMKSPKKLNYHDPPCSMEICQLPTGRHRVELDTLIPTTTPVQPAGPMVWSSDGRLLALTDSEGTIRIWDTASKHRIAQIGSGELELNWSNNRNMLRMLFTPDNRGLIVNRDNGLLYLYSLRTCLPVALVGDASISGYSQAPYFKNRVLWLTFSPNGDTLYGIPEYSPGVLAWDMPKVVL